VPDLVQLVKRAALDAVKSQRPVEVLFGTVVSVSPLRISLDQKLHLGGSQLLSPKSLPDLHVGERVLLLQVQGGQKFVVLDSLEG
jgi:hypothetical protein